MSATQLSQTELLKQMKEKLAKLVPEPELPIKAELIHEINQLKKERNAVILGHNYMEPALYHFVSDIRGDSLELCRKAAETDKEIIVFCGVHFMAESAKILNPEKTVLIPSKKAGCSLAESITAEDVKKIRQAYPGVPIVTYVNTYADVKAESDVCCTSGNAEAVIRSLDSDTIIYLPDKFMAANLAKETGKEILFPFKEDGTVSLQKPESGKKSIIGWHGCCEVHELFTRNDVENVQKQFPGVVALAHPECPPEVVDASDYSNSTSGMVKFVQENDAPHYLLLTECNMGDNIIAENPTKDILRLCSHRCQHMNQITLEQTLDALKKTQYVVQLDEEVRVRARKALDRMLEID
jgi:quinolinate synthase